jgi:hypothetical protein
MSQWDGNRVSRATLFSRPPFEELPRTAGAVWRCDTRALRLRALASLLLALERRPIPVEQPTKFKLVLRCHS